jgi:hypothetical protein
MGEVVVLPVETTLDIPVERVLDGKEARALDSVVVIGLDKNGELYLASSSASYPLCLTILELGKWAILRRIEEGS